jgi:hypothetical protein
MIVCANQDFEKMGVINKTNHEDFQRLIKTSQKSTTFEIW